MNLKGAGGSLTNKKEVITCKGGQQKIREAAFVAAVKKGREPG